MEMLKYNHGATAYLQRCYCESLCGVEPYKSKSIKDFFKPGSKAFNNSLSRELSQLQDKPGRTGGASTCELPVLNPEAPSHSDMKKNSEKLFLFQSQYNN